MPHVPPRPLSHLPGYVLAAPSWVIPGTLAENCRFLAGRVDEVGLLFLETSACLAYGEKELPRSLARLPLSFHVHLPVDLPMEDPLETARICGKLMEKAAFLGAARAVLHPPAGTSAARRMALFARAWEASGREPSDILLENTEECDLRCLAGVMEDYSLGVCVDLGHALAYGQRFLADMDFPSDGPVMLHMSAPGPEGRLSRHRPLTALSDEERCFARRLCQRLAPGATVMAELFNWPDVEASVPLLRQWCTPEKG